MPELPEVEYARGRLLRWTKGARIEEARSYDSLVVMDADAFGALVGARVRDVKRRGKNLLIETDDDRGLWFHLGMTGHLEVLPPRAPIDAATLPRFARCAIRTPSNTVVLTDGRRLGRAHAGPLAAIREQHLGALGPEATEVTDEILARVLDTKLVLKVALMDQSRLAGLGNIHAAEALYLAKLHPERPSRTTTEDERALLAAAIKEALARAMVSPDEDLVYVNEGGPNTFFVYGKEGEPCSRCGAKITRVSTAGRSTYLCPKCQPARAAAPRAVATKARAAAPKKAAKRAAKKLAKKAKSPSRTRGKSAR